MILTCFFNTAAAILLPARSRDQTSPPALRVNLASVPLVCSFRRVKIHPAPTPDFRPAKIFIPSDRKTGLPQDTHATERRHRCTPPSLPLHSGSQVSSLRGIDQRDQSGFGFSAIVAPNPKPLSSRRAGAPTTNIFAGDNFTGTESIKILPFNRPIRHSPPLGARQETPLSNLG